MSYREAHQEPYTKYPNRYNDVIKPRLTDTQRDICDVVIRMTYGWHQTSAEISNSTFARKANKSVQGVINAKKKLEEMGLLVVLEKGGGSKKGKYMLDLYYDNPEKSVKASMIRQKEQFQELRDSSLAENQEYDTQSLAPHTDELTEPQPEQVNQAEDPESEELEAEESVKKSEVLLKENRGPVEEISESTCQAEIPDTPEAENPIGIEAHELPTTKLSLPPYKEDLSNNISNKKEKQTGEPKPEKKKAAVTVRYKFLSIFPEAQADDDWQFFGWIAKEYGLEACLAKLDYMKEHRKQHNITNPKGFFRTALVRDFQPPAFIVAKLKADERANREKERFQKESEQWDATVANFNYESARASVEKFLEMLN